jgi:hypothetical protein
MIPLMNKRPSSNWTKVGSITTRLAARLVARRDAEIIRDGGAPTVPGVTRGENPVAGVDGTAQDRTTVEHLNEKGRTYTRRGYAQSSEGGDSLRAGKGAPKAMGDSLGRCAARVQRGSVESSANNVIEFAARVWGTCRAAGLAPNRPPSQGAGPADYHCSDLAASGPRIDLTLRYVRRCSVPIAGIPADLLAAHTLPPADCMLSKCGK